MAKWLLKKCSADPEKLKSFYGCGKPLAYALYHRGIRNRDKLKEYTNIDDFLFEPFVDFKDSLKAFEIVKKALEQGKNICIYGDYDVDGVMSTTILYKGLKGLDAKVTYAIPHRIEEGYGISEDAVKGLYRKGVQLIIACDNGISAAKAVDRAKELGMEIIILDHHEPAFVEKNGKRESIIPCADAVIDAKIEDSGYVFPHMCAGALCYRFVKALYEYLGKKLLNEEELVIFAAMATVCDVVDLTGENRAIAKRGIELINSRVYNIGLKKLIELRELNSISAYHIGFILGPCINAGGRLDTAERAVRLFTTEDKKEAEALALELIEYNEDRKTMTAKGVEEITELIESTDLKNDSIIVVLSKTVHESIAGIIAGRIKDRYYRPVIVLTKTEKAVKGSGRSIEAYNMFEGLYNAKELMLKFGGHTMAAGLSMEEENVDKLRKRLNESCTLEEKDMVPVIRLDAQLRLGDITEKAIDELDILNPYGKANERPVYGSKNIGFRFIRFVGKEKNIVSLTIEDETGRRIRAVDFDNCSVWQEKLNEMGYSVENTDRAMIKGDAVYTLDINEFNGTRNPQLIIKDVRFRMQ